jgi:hypothetical protein
MQLGSEPNLGVSHASRNSVVAQAHRVWIDGGHRRVRLRLANSGAEHGDDTKRADAGQLIDTPPDSTIGFGIGR